MGNHNSIFTCPPFDLTFRHGHAHTFLWITKFQSGLVNSKSYLPGVATKVCGSVCITYMYVYMERYVFFCIYVCVCMYVCISIYKYYGDQVRIASDTRWTKGMKMKLMESACWAKFSQNRFLADVRLSTGDKTLVEASPHNDCAFCSCHPLPTWYK